MSATKPFYEGTGMQLTVSEENGSVLEIYDESSALEGSNMMMYGGDSSTIEEGDRGEVLGATGVDLARLPLDRLIYTIHATGMPAGAKVDRGKRAVEGENCVYQGWPMYNDFKPIIKEDEHSWPPAYVILQDWHVFQIVKAGIAIQKRRDLWPADFHLHHVLHEQRNCKGRAAKVNVDGIFYYIILSSGHQLSGDEGSQAVITIPKDVWATVKPKTGDFILGQRCEVQDDFVPDNNELERGTLASRLPAGSGGPHPLNNRNNWGSLTKIEIPKEAATIATGAANTRKRSSIGSLTSARKVVKTSGSASPAAKATQATTKVKKSSNKAKARVESVAASDSQSFTNALSTKDLKNEPILNLSSSQITQQDALELLQESQAFIQQIILKDVRQAIAIRLEGVANMLDAVANFINNHVGQDYKEINYMDTTPAATPAATPESSQSTQ